jgi:hypothetical protein
VARIRSLAALAALVVIAVVMLAWFARSTPVAGVTPVAAVTPVPAAPRAFAAIAKRATASSPRSADRSSAASTVRVADPAVMERLNRDVIPGVMPQLQACYERSLPELGYPRVELEVDLTLTADPDVGTLVDADVVLDPVRRLPGALVDCLRAELQAIELSGLSDGERIAARYPLAFGTPRPSSADRPRR